jgi:two-component system response regulator AtoC
MFLTYDWPGNIRELENMIKRIVILQDEQLVIREIERNRQRTHAVPALALAGASVAANQPVAASVGAGSPVGLPSAVEPESERDTDDVEPVEEGSSSLAEVAKAAAMKAERSAIETTLRQVHWNRRKAAQHLGVSYKTLLNKIKECGISRA